MSVEHRQHILGGESCCAGKGVEALEGDTARATPGQVEGCPRNRRHRDASESGHLVIKQSVPDCDDARR